MVLKRKLKPWQGGTELATNDNSFEEVRRLSGLNYEYDADSERFATKEELSASYEHFSIHGKSKLKEGGVPFAYLPQSDEVLVTGPETHVFVIGESGCGKTRRLVLPTIHTSSCAGRSMVISDPKGELYRETANELKVKGYAVKVLNLRSPLRGDRWNPFALIEQMVNSDDIDIRGKGELLLKALCDSFISRVNSEKDKFWQNASAQVIMGTASYLMRTEKNITLSKVYDTMKTFFDLAKSKSKRGRSNASAFTDLYMTMPEGSSEKNNLRLLASGDYNVTIQGIEMTAEAAMSYYISQTSLVQMFSGNDITPKSLANSKTAIYVILPDDSESMYGIATIFVNQVYSVLLGEADARENGVLKHKVDFILDEFANFAPLGSVGALLTAARSRGIRFILICQSLEQLDHKYGTYEAETLRSNCRVWIYMGCRNHNFLQRLEQECGMYQYRYSRETVPLVSMSRLLHLQKGEVLVLNDREHPYLGILPDWSAYERSGEESAKASLPEIKGLKTSSPKRKSASTKTTGKGKKANGNLSEFLKVLNDDDDDDDDDYDDDDLFE